MNETAGSAHTTRPNAVDGTGWTWRALRPSSATWAFAPALRAVAAAGIIAVAGIATGSLDAVALTYFGAACSVMFVTRGPYRTRTIALACQASGAMAGISVGVLAPHNIGVMTATAAVVAMISGMIGAIGPMATAFALMAVIGLGFGQFAGLPLPWWQQALCYLVGTIAVFIASVPIWALGRNRIERGAIADVFERSARLLAELGSPGAADARRDLAAASAASRAAFYDHRLTDVSERPRMRRLSISMASSQLTALAAAALYARGAPVPPDAVRAVRATAEDVRSDRMISHAPDVPANPATLAPLARALGVMTLERAPAEVVSHPLPPLVRLWMLARIATTPVALRAGARLALCMSAATALTSLLHTESHSYWLPLTVAVIVRPEYGSVFVRTVNRGIGTLAGAALAACVLLLAPSGIVVAAAAAVSIGFAVLAAPKLYALSVVGITASALLSSCIGTPDPAVPLFRVTDTVIGCAVAIVFGYLLWPGSRRLPDDARLVVAADAAADYFHQAVQASSGAGELAARRDRAYRLAHRTRAAVQAALAEPPPVSTVAAAALPAANSIEDVVDGITALAAEIDMGARPPAEADARALESGIRDLGASGRGNSGPARPSGDEPDPIERPNARASIMDHLERVTVGGRPQSSGG